MSFRPVLWSIVLLLVAATTGLLADTANAIDSGPGKTPIQRAAAEAPATGQARPADSAGTTLVLLGLLLAGAIVGRRLVQRRIEKHSPRTHNPVRLLSRQQIDPELSVRLLQVGSRLLVVAATPQGVATLSEITDPEEIALLSGEMAATTQDAAPFAGDRPIAVREEPPSPPQQAATPPAASDRWIARLDQPVRAGG